MRNHDEFSHDLEEASSSMDSRRKRNKLTHPTSRLCYDWMVVSGNCHYARDREVFSTYRPVSRCLKNNVFSPMDELQVAGVGTVELNVCRTPRDNGTTSHVIVLENVLHIPDAVCNGFNPLLLGSSMSCDWYHWEGADRNGDPVWYSLPYAGGTRLVLAGGPQGESELIPGKHYTLSLSMTPEERRDILFGGVEGIAMGL